MFSIFSRLIVVLIGVFLTISLFYFLSYISFNHPINQKNYKPSLLKNSCFPFIALYIANKINLEKKTKILSEKNQNKKNSSTRAFLKRNHFPLEKTKILDEKNHSEKKYQNLLIKKISSARAFLKRNHFPLEKFLLFLPLSFDPKTKKYIIKNSYPIDSQIKKSIFSPYKHYGFANTIYLKAEDIVKFFPNQKIFTFIDYNKRNFKSPAAIQSLKKIKNISFLSSNSNKFLKEILQENLNVNIIQSFQTLIRFEILENLKLGHLFSFLGHGIITSSPLYPDSKILLKLKNKNQIVFIERINSFYKIEKSVKKEIGGWISEDLKSTFHFIRSNNPCFVKKKFLDY